MCFPSAVITSQHNTHKHNTYTLLRFTITSYLLNTHDIKSTLHAYSAWQGLTLQITCLPYHSPAFLSSLYLSVRSQSLSPAKTTHACETIFFCGISFNWRLNQIFAFRIQIYLPFCRTTRGIFTLLISSL